MLNEQRKYYVTASLCHRVMAGYEAELAGRSAKEPDFASFAQISAWVEDNGKKPLVGELKADGVIATGAEIKESWDYIRSQVKVFSEGMESVSREIAMSEFITARDPGPKTDDMERGHAQEGEAIEYLSKITGIKFVDTASDQRFFTKDSLGVTPDGIQINNDFEVVSCAEVKNPKDTTHMKYLLLVQDQQTLLQVVPLYYWQAQCGLHVTGAKCYHWMSYHNKFDLYRDFRGVYVRIEPNQEHIDMLVERAERVISRSKDIIEIIFSMESAKARNEFIKTMEASI